MKRLLIIGGSDTSAGAGIQADLKTCSAIGLYGLTVITAVTSQNTKGVSNILFVPREHIESQLDAIAQDISFDAVKIGMLGNEDAAETVGRFLAKAKKPFVLDPVMVAQSGSRLSSGDIFEKLLQLCALVTPNAAEAEKLTGIRVRSVSDMEKAALLLAKKAKRVLVKGGDTAFNWDVYAEKGELVKLPIDRVRTKNNHGSGCSLATAITCYYIKTGDFRNAVEKARQFVRTALIGGIPLGSRFGTLDQFAAADKEWHRYEAVEALYSAYSSMKGKGLGKLIPEIQSNLAFMLPHGEGPQDVAGFPGRIIRIGDDIHAACYPAFGASRHVANVVMAANRFFPEIRSAMAIRYERSLVTLIRKAGFTVASFERTKEPKTVKEKEGSSLDWGVTDACRRLRKAPDVIYDEGDLGKEPVIRIFGETPAKVAEKVMRIGGLLE